MTQAANKAKDGKGKHAARLRVLAKYMAAGQIAVKRFRDPAVSLNRKQNA